MNSLPSQQEHQPETRSAEPSLTVVFFILLVTRVAGRRELSSLEPFDAILLVVLGALVQQGITQSDQSVTGTLTVISTTTLLSVAFSWASFRSRKIRLVTEGEPLILARTDESSNATCVASA